MLDTQLRYIVDIMIIFFSFKFIYRHILYYRILCYMYEISGTI